MQKGTFPRKRRWKRGPPRSGHLNNDFESCQIRARATRSAESEARGEACAEAGDRQRRSAREPGTCQRVAACTDEQLQPAGLRAPRLLHRHGRCLQRLWEEGSVDVTAAEVV